MDLNLHDWTLLGVALTFDSGSFILQLRGPDNDYQLAFHDFAWFELSKQDFWGPNDSILSSTLLRGDGDAFYLAMTLQSGDFLKVEAKAPEMSELSRTPMDVQIDVPLKLIEGKQFSGQQIRSFSKIAVSRAQLKSRDFSIESELDANLSATSRMKILFLSSGDRITVEYQI